MGRIIWIKEAGDIGPEIQITQKILILEQIWIYYNSDKLLNTKSCRKLPKVSKMYKKHKNTSLYVEDMIRIPNWTETKLNKMR
jgi:hypothetical protein